MATNLLSAVQCKSATSKGAAVRKLHDGDGLYLWVYPDGRKYWRMRYWQVGKEKSLSIGVYPNVSLSAAREKREELRKQLAADLDPSAERKAANLRKKAFRRELFRGCCSGVVPQTTPYLGAAPCSRREAPPRIQHFSDHR